MSDFYNELPIRIFIFLKVIKTSRLSLFCQVLQLFPEPLPNYFIVVLLT